MVRIRALLGYAARKEDCRLQASKGGTMASQDKMNFCVMREDEFVCSSYEHRQKFCKHSDGYSCSFFNHENACCKSDPAKKEAAEIAVRLGQEYLVRVINEEVTTTKPAGLNPASGNSVDVLSGAEH